MAPFPSATSKWHDKRYQAISPTRSELSARGKSVLITGGGTGIGAETARCFAEAGAPRIALLGRREQPLLDTKASIQHSFPDVEVFVASTDVTDKSEVDTAFAMFIGEGKLDVLVSGAAVNGPLDSVEAIDGDKFLDAIQKNVMGVLFVAQGFLRYASTNAVAIEINSSAAYGFTGFSNPGLNVFHLQPGIVDTHMNKEVGSVKALGYEDHVSLPGSFNVWLASPEARFLKGKFLWANWDVDELKEQSQELSSVLRLSDGRLIMMRARSPRGTYDLPAEITDDKNSDCGGSLVV